MAPEARLSQSPLFSAFRFWDSASRREQQRAQRAGAGGEPGPLALQGLKQARGWSGSWPRPGCVPKPEWGNGNRTLLRGTGLQHQRCASG